MMTYNKILLLHFLQLAFVAGAILVAMVAPDIRLLVVCLICVGIFNVRFLFWLYHWLHKIKCTTNRLADTASPADDVAGPFQQIEADLVAVERKLDKPLLSLRESAAVYVEERAAKACSAATCEDKESVLISRVGMHAS